MANARMSELWNGPATAAWVQAPDRYDVMLAGLGAVVLDAARLQAGERVLDVGCGSGALAREAAARVGPSGHVLGVDVSAPLVALGRERSQQLGNVELVVADAQEHPLTPASFDVLVSRFGVMFFEDPVRAFSNLRAAVVPGGRLAFVCWQPAVQNEWMMLAVGAVVPHVGLPEDLPPPGAPGPFAFGEADHVEEVLSSAGWSGVALEDVRTTVPVGGASTAEEVARYFEQDLIGQAFLAGRPPEQRAAALQALTQAAQERMTDGRLDLGAAVWVVTASRG